jgi:nucleotide-binding universal stress UspA family protein
MSISEHETVTKNADTIHGAARVLGANAPTPEEELIVYEYILIATDGSDLAMKAVDHGLALAKALNAKAIAITATESWTSFASGEMAMAFPIEDYEKGCAEGAAKILGAVSNRADKIGITCKTLHVKDQFAAEGILEAAKSLGCDLIVMASHGRRGLPRLLLGSQANKVVTHSAVPVLICR